MPWASGQGDFAGEVGGVSAVLGAAGQAVEQVAHPLAKAAAGEG